MRSTTLLPLVVVPTLAVLTASCHPVEEAPVEAVPPPKQTDWRAADPLVQLTNRGVALLEQYDYAKAVEAFEQALALAPDSTQTRLNLAIAVFNRAGKDDVARTEQLLDQVIAAAPNDVAALFFRGIMHQYSGRDEQAAVLFERVLEAYPRDACTWYLLARSRAHLGQSSRVALEHAIEANPALASAHYDLMRVAAQEGKRDEAKARQAAFVKLRQSPLSEVVAIPNYRQMGPLAVARPLPGQPKQAVAGGALTAAAVRTVLAAAITRPGAGDSGSGFGVQVALADVNADGHLDLVTTGQVRAGRGGVSLLLGQPDGSLADATAASGLGTVEGAVSCAFGDFDNDDHVDLFVSCVGPNHLFRGGGDGTFQDVTAPTATAGPGVVSLSAAFLDADHDGDLDIYVCNARSLADGAPAANQLLNNNTVRECENPLTSALLTSEDRTPCDIKNKPFRICSRCEQTARDLRPTNRIEKVLVRTSNDCLRTHP